MARNRSNLFQLAISLIVCLAVMSLPLVAADQQKKDQPPDFDGLKALKHPDPDVRMNAAQLLCDLGPVAKFAIAALHEQLKTDESPVVRVKVAEALWKIEKPAARELLPVLLEALTDKHDAARSNAANVIGQIGSAAKSAVPALSKALQDKDLTVRIEAALALGEIGPAAKAAIPELLATMKSDDLQLLEPFVVGTLGKIGEDAVPLLIVALTAKESRLRRGAACALGLIGPNAVEAVESLGNMLADSEPNLRAIATIALGKIGKEAKSTVPLLQKQLADKEPFPRIQAAVALWHIGKNDAGVAVLVEALKHENAAVREQACRGVAEISEVETLPPSALQGALRDAEPSVQILAAEALGKMGQKAEKSLPALREAFKNENGLVRASAALAVWRIDPKAKDVLPALVLWLSAKDALSRQAAATTLGEMGTGALSAWGALLETYREDASAQVQRAAAAALKKIDAKAAAKAGVR